MTEAKAELLGRGGPPERISGEDTDRRIQAERQSIGKQLHQGILQELTVAGLRLKALEDTAAAPTAKAIGELAGWLRERQAELRQMVSQLEQGRPGGTIDPAVIVAELGERYGCEVSFSPQFRSGWFEPDIWSAMVATVQDVAHVLADALSAHRVEIVLPRAAQPTLQITHDGRRLSDHPEHLAAIRTVVGRSGASLQLGARGAAEQFTLDWAA